MNDDYRWAPLGGTLARMGMPWIPLYPWATRRDQLVGLPCTRSPRVAANAAHITEPADNPF